MNSFDIDSVFHEALNEFIDDTIFFHDENSKQTKFYENYSILFESCAHLMLLLSKECSGSHRFLNVVEEMDDHKFFKHFRLTRNTFDCLLEEIKKRYQRNVKGPEPMPSKVGLLMTLKYLGTQSSLQHIGHLFEVCESAVHKTVFAFINVIADMSNEYIKWPSNNNADAVEKGFKNVCGFPGILGALDCCYINVTVPKDMQTDFVDKMNHFSVNFIAVCDFRKEFTFVDADCPGSLSDQKAFELSLLGKNFLKNPHSVFFNDYYHLVADGGFTLNMNIMVPYSDKESFNTNCQFNSKLLKSRFVIEEAFKSLISRFQRLKHITVSVHKVSRIIIAACVLHNFALNMSDDFIFLKEYFEHTSLSNNYEFSEAVASKKSLAKRDRLARLLFNT